MWDCLVHFDSKCLQSKTGLYYQLRKAEVLKTDSRKILGTAKRGMHLIRPCCSIYKTTCLASSLDHCMHTRGSPTSSGDSLLSLGHLPHCEFLLSRMESRTPSLRQSNPAGESLIAKQRWGACPWDALFFWGEVNKEFKSLNTVIYFLLLNKLEHVQLIILVIPNRLIQKESSLAMGNLYEPNILLPGFQHTARSILCYRL